MLTSNYFKSTITMGRHTKSSKTLELMDLAELANTNVYKGITKFNGIGRKRKLAWKTFTQQLKSYLTTATSREKSIIYGKEILLTNDNVNLEAKITFDDMVVEDAAQEQTSCSKRITSGKQTINRC